MKSFFPDFRLASLVAFLVLLSGHSLSASDILSSTETIRSEVENGNFAVAGAMIDRDLVRLETKPEERLYWNFQKERMARIRYDFRADEQAVLSFIKRYYPDVTSEQLQKWKAAKSLETMQIDGKECYFHAAAANLFRIDKDAVVQKRKIDGPPDPRYGDFIRRHAQIVRRQGAETHSPTGLEPKTFRMTYTLTVPADTVPDGETLRCWLPYPYRGHRRQTEIELLDSNLLDPVISPKEFLHSSIYSEKIARKGQPTVFQVRFGFRSTAECFDMKSKELRDKIKSYDRNSALYREYTAERAEHVVFTPEIRQLSREIVGNETDPLGVVEKIYGWIVANIPWASSREYSTMPNIPGYVLENRHGDCGMVALLLVTLCRHNGIPAKWQSGFMLYPGYSNLHDWAEAYFEGIGWVPVDPSQGSLSLFREKDVPTFYLGGIDSYRLIVNENFSDRLYPAKIHPRSETVDFQRGEVEWRGGNLYFNRWRWKFELEYFDEPSSEQNR